MGEGAVQVAGDGGDDVALGHSVVAGVGEALAARNAAPAAAAAAAALALIDLGGAGPHRHGAAALWEVCRKTFCIRLTCFF